MELSSAVEVEVTREKLKRLGELYEEKSSNLAEQTFARELTLRSLRMMMKPFREEIARFEARFSQGGDDGSTPEQMGPVHASGAERASTI